MRQAVERSVVTQLAKGTPGGETAEACHLSSAEAQNQCATSAPCFGITVPAEKNCKVLCNHERQKWKALEW